ncbi:hypothetical protein EW026_g3720 [Hermanssonia centrifuga]|uniref:Uncharacterized protein n=1 Tax=Hermanssonia centrifuga TaxID=98765 RepID=A0A4S4KKD9_9APHY|nr:hypothetical protein EW026_g3720 [Hermanssonia centrifuga]
MAESEGTSNNAVRLTTIEEPAAVTEPKTTLTGTKDEVKAPATNGDTAKVDTAEGKTKSAGLTSGSRATAPNAEAAATEAVLINGSNAAIVPKPSDVGAESEDSQIGQAVLSPLGETPLKSTETPMDIEKEKDEDVVKPVSKLLPPEDPNSNQEKQVPDVQILQRNLGEDDLIFDTDGISILGNEVENGMRRGWKIKARSWRWAEPLLKETV